MGPRGAGRRLNDQERMEILDIMARESKVKNVDLAKRYGVSEGAIRKLKQIKDTIRDRYYLGNEHNRDKRKRGGFARNAPFEQELYEWICRMRESQAYQLIPLTQTAVRQQAILLAKNYDSMSTFKASPGWFARFCSRHRLDPPMSHPPGEEAMLAGAVAVDAVAAASRLDVPELQMEMPPGAVEAMTSAQTAAMAAMLPPSVVASVAPDLTTQPTEVKPAEMHDLNCAETMTNVPEQEVKAEVVKPEDADPTAVTAQELNEVKVAAETQQQKAIESLEQAEDEIFSLGL